MKLKEYIDKYSIRIIDIANALNVYPMTIYRVRDGQDPDLELAIQLEAYTKWLKKDVKTINGKEITESLTVYDLCSFKKTKGKNLIEVKE